tara:strand:- start:9119 stop:9997 length:879 start_codon:yes stop_codon:yes gene_type:complete
MSYFYDVMASFLILLIFGIIFLGLIIAAMAKNIEKNWPKYKCNPIVIPMAGYLGKDAVKNFTECIGDIQGGFMGLFLAPLKYIMAILVGLGATIMESVENVRGMFNSLVGNILGMFGNILGIFLNIGIQSQLMMVNIKDLIMKIVGILYTVGLLLAGIATTGKSVMNGPIGDLLDTFGCFPQNTKIKLLNGTYKEMSKLNLGDKLISGGSVHAILRVRGGERNPYYKIYSTELKEYIYVTGDHLIKDNGKFKPVKELKESIKTNKWDKEMSCLVTTNNLIPIGEYVFWDWED